MNGADGANNAKIQNDVRVQGVQDTDSEFSERDKLTLVIRPSLSSLRLLAPYKCCEGGLMRSLCR